MPHSEYASPERESMPYWLVNLPKDEWPASCPEFLRDISVRNKDLLSVSDDKFKRIDWERVNEIVHHGDINEFRRLPSELRKYLEWSADVKTGYESLKNFVLSQRLQWTDLKPRGRPFEYAEDYKILYNDWPYGTDENIIHLVCWVKFELAEDPVTNRSTPQSHQEMGDYVNRTFGSRMPKSSVVWFKNYKTLKSIHELEHFHIMINNPPDDFLREVTEGDVPMMKRIRG